MTIRRTITAFLLAAQIVAFGPALAFGAVDRDHDGVGDNLDNCLGVPNAEQRDTDSDGIGNACDPDLNDDCTVDQVDLDLLTEAFFNPHPSADLNGDGLVNVIDRGTLKRYLHRAPGPSGAPNHCSCRPPSSPPGANNAEFGGEEMFLLGDLAGAGKAVPGVNNFADQGDGRYITRAYARTPGKYAFSVVANKGSPAYCSQGSLVPYAAASAASGSCPNPSGSLEISTPGCYQLSMVAEGGVPPAAVDLTLVQRLAHWDISVDPSGGSFVLPNGVLLDIPPGAVEKPVTLTMGDVPCSQVDALYGASAVSSHDKRCIGALSGEPDGFSFSAPVTVHMPVNSLLPGEIPLWTTSSRRDRNYQLVPGKATYHGERGVLVAKLNGFSILGGSGANLLPNPNNPSQGLPPNWPNCFNANPALNDPCCSGNIEVISKEGHTISSDCDLCQLLGYDLSVRFLDCGGPTVHTPQIHATNGCPADLTTKLTPSSLELWTCEDRTIEATISGTRKDGKKCNMLLPADWAAGDSSLLRLKDKPPNGVQITGLAGGTTTVEATSSLGAQFSASASVEVVDLEGGWRATEQGSETCTVYGSQFVEHDRVTGTVQVTTPSCSQISFDVGYPGAPPFDAALTKTGNPAAPFTFTLTRTNDPNTVGCTVFRSTNGNDSDFGGILCPGDATCWNPSCSESTTDQGTIHAASKKTGEATSNWSFTAGLTYSYPDDPAVYRLSASCSGSSRSTLNKN